MREQKESNRMIMHAGSYMFIILALIWLIGGIAIYIMVDNFRDFGSVLAVMGAIVLVVAVIMFLKTRAPKTSVINFDEITATNGTNTTVIAANEEASLES